MTKKERATACIERLKNKYPSALCSLNYEEPLQLLIATRLSAQCTDARVNLITPALFEKYKTLDDFCAAELSDVERIIKSCGFYHTKARDIIEMSKMIKADFNGKVPDNIEDLTKLSGVGRKTANLIIGDIYKKPAIVCDTHLIRISKRIGLTDTKDPLKTEIQLKKILPPEESNDFCHRCVLLGRECCTARKAKCDICPLNDVCKKTGV